MMRALEAVIEVSPDGSAVIKMGKWLKPGLHKILIITDETAVPEGTQLRKEEKFLRDLKPIHARGWQKNSTYRREEIYNDDGR